LLKLGRPSAPLLEFNNFIVFLLICILLPSVFLTLFSGSNPLLSTDPSVEHVFIFVLGSNKLN